MARLPRCTAADLPHLVELRWSAEAKARMGADLLLVLRHLLGDALPRHGVSLHAYALGRTRAVLLLTPESAEGVSRLVQDVCRRLAAKVRHSYGASGPLLAGRFRSTILQPDRHFLQAMLYAEQLPRREAEHVGEGEWSSAAFHCGASQDPLISDHPLYWLSGNTPFEREARHKQRLVEPLDATVRDQFDVALAGGWPFGDDAFLRDLAPQVSRPLVRRSPGRPRRVKQGGADDVSPIYSRPTSSKIK